MLVIACIATAWSLSSMSHYYYYSHTGLLILQYFIAILSIANTDFSIAKVSQYCLKICICIGLVATTFSSSGKSNYYQYQYQ